MSVRVFLDFDGVLNPETKSPKVALTDWNESLVMGVPIAWSPTIARRIARLAECAEVLWLTTWGHDAQSHLAQVMGLPRFELAGTDPADTPWRWWKHDVVTEFWNTDRRPFVWIDDDLAVFDEASAWMTALAPDQALAVVPEASAGLGPEALDRIDSFIARHQRSRGAAKPTRAVE